MVKTISWYVWSIIYVVAKTPDFIVPNTDTRQKGDTNGMIVLFRSAKIRRILRNSLNYVYAVSQPIRIHSYLQRHF